MSERSSSALLANDTHLFHPEGLPRKPGQASPGKPWMPSRMKPWKTLGSTKIVSDRWLHLTADRCALDSGKIIDPYYVMHEKDWVIVFAQTEDARILVVRQFRYAAGVFCSELPGGVVDEGESPLQAAERELLEETGHSAPDWVAIGSMYANPVRQTNSIHVFFAKGAQLVSEQKLDHGEELTFHLATLGEVERMIDSNEFSHSLHVASFYRVLAFLAAGT